MMDGPIVHTDDAGYMYGVACGSRTWAITLTQPPLSLPHGAAETTSAPNTPEEPETFRFESPTMSAFHDAVYSAIQEIPRGRVTTYGHIAALIGTRT